MHGGKHDPLLSLVRSPALEFGCFHHSFGIRMTKAHQSNKHDIDPSVVFWWFKEAEAKLENSHSSKAHWNQQFFMNSITGVDPTEECRAKGQGKGRHHRNNAGHVSVAQLCEVVGIPQHLDIVDSSNYRSVKQPQGIVRFLDKGFKDRKGLGSIKSASGFLIMWLFLLNKVKS